MSGSRSLAARAWGVVPIAIVVGLFALRAGLAVPPLDRLAPVPGEPRDPPGTRARAGSLDVARGGPVVIGFQSPGPARLQLAGRDIASTTKDCHAIASGFVCRIIVPHGPTAIRFAAPPSARLVWSPVGRRGDPEYLPASSLSPEAPERATFGADAGAARVDGLIALAILAVLVATLLGLARHRLARVPAAMWLAMGLVLVGALVARRFGQGGFGTAWDEDTNWAAGRNYVSNVLAGDFAARSWIWNYEHPPVMKYLEGVGALLADGFGPARALSALWTAIGCALLVPIGARLYRLRVGVLAAAIAALLPPLVAHGQIVGHESPSVLWWTLGILLALGVHDGLPPAPTRAAVRTLCLRLAWVGVVIGVAVASRFVNGLLGVLCGLVVVIQAPRAWRRATSGWGALLMTSVAVGTVYLLWPRLWVHPIRALGESLKKLDTVHSLEPFLGATTNHPGPHYFLVYLLATLPIGALVGVVAWAVQSARELRRVRPVPRGTLVLGAWLLVPLLVAASPVRQDGVRYVMPCVVALAVAAAAGWDALARWLEPRLRHAFVSFAIALVVYLGIVDVRVDPYYLDYFGEQVGGAGAVAARGWFETAWWGEGVADAVAYVNAHAAVGARVYRECIEPVHLAWFREDLWAPMTGTPADATWLIAYAPAGHRCPIPADARRVYAVTSGELVLAEVWQRP